MNHITRVETASFPQRKDRSEYIAKKYSTFLKGSVLDVGCYECDLKYMISSSSYTGIDISGDPDVYIDLDSIDALPFADNEFDTVVCSDVLEHLDELHLIFSELIRVSKREVIISLPNCWNAVRRPIERGYGCAAHYGLPLTKPDDRHRWFFSYSEILNFCVEQSLRSDISINSIVVNARKRNIIIEAVRKLLFIGKDKYLNRYSHTVWVHYSKKISGVKSCAEQKCV